MSKRHRVGHVLLTTVNLQAGHLHQQPSLHVSEHGRADTVKFVQVRRLAATKNTSLKGQAPQPATCLSRHQFWQPWADCTALRSL